MELNLKLVLFQLLDFLSPHSLQLRALLTQHANLFYLLRKARFGTVGAVSNLQLLVLLLTFPVMFDKYCPPLLKISRKSVSDANRASYYEQGNNTVQIKPHDATDCQYNQRYSAPDAKPAASPGRACLRSCLHFQIAIRYRWDWWQFAQRGEIVDSFPKSFDIRASRKNNVDIYKKNDPMCFDWAPRTRS